jgi:hypothetical protein
MGLNICGSPFFGWYDCIVFVEKNLFAPAGSAGDATFGVNITLRQGNANLISGFYGKNPNLPKKSPPCIEKNVLMYYI